MSGYRTEARTTQQIIDSMECIKNNARDDLKVIHLIPCDFAKVVTHPARFNVVKQMDGTLQTVWRGKMIAVMAVR